MSRRQRPELPASPLGLDALGLHATARKLVLACLDLVDEGGHPRTANLRQVAARVGFAHTSAYNYFCSYDELLWYAIVEALRRLVQFAQSRLASSDNGAALVRAIVTAEAEFAMAHPGLYRLISFEVISTAPPAPVRAQLDASRDFFTQVIHRAGGDVDRRTAQRIGNIVHGYAHGDISKLLHERTVVNNATDAANKIADNAARVFSLLLAESKRAPAGQDR